MNLKTLIIVLAAVTTPGLAQDQPPTAKTDARAAGVDPAAGAFIDKFRSALKDVRDLSCTVEQKMTTEGEPATTGSGDVVLTVTRNPGGAGTLKQFRISIGGDTGSVWAFDGKASSRIDHSRKTFATIEAPEGVAFPAEDARPVVPTWALGDVLMTPRAKLVAAKMLPDAESNGVKCRVVEYTVEIPLMMRSEDGQPSEPARTVLRQVRHVGADDLLPRRIESWTTYAGNVPEGATPRSFQGVYTNVKANTNPDSATFTLKTPAGYELAKADPAELGVPSDEAPALKFAAGDAAPAFALKDPDGKETTLAALKGRVVLLDFWATWCGPCKAAMPSIQKLHEKYGAKPVSIFGVNTWERGAADLAQKYMAKNKFTYGLLLKGDDLAKAYGISGIPTFVLIGPDGKILHIGVGFGEGEEEKLEAQIDKALAAK